MYLLPSLHRSGTLFMWLAGVRLSQPSLHKQSGLWWLLCDSQLWTLIHSLGNGLGRKPGGWGGQQGVRWGKVGSQRGAGLLAWLQPKMLDQPYLEVIQPSCARCSSSLNWFGAILKPQLRTVTFRSPQLGSPRAQILMQLPSSCSSVRSGASYRNGTGEFVD